ncbi:MAG: CDP-alcohol phosphatidyltransferase family protein [Patescibacteria group bacterium]
MNPEKDDGFIEKTYNKIFYGVRSLIDKVSQKPLKALSKKVHPDSITLSRIPIGVLVLLAYLIDQKEIAAALYFFNYFLDVLDGMVARVSGQETGNGARLDPFVDKLTNYPLLAIVTGKALVGSFSEISFNSLETAIPFFRALILTSLMFKAAQNDDESMQLRGGFPAGFESIAIALSRLKGQTITNPKPNPEEIPVAFGKTKFVFQSGAILNSMLNGASLTTLGLLGTSIILGRGSVRKRSALKDTPSPHIRPDPS